MRALAVLAHPERRSFNGALFQAAVETLRSSGQEVRTSDLYAQKFDPVSDRRNFTSLKDPGYFKQQLEEMHATETRGFAPDIEEEMSKVEWCEFMVWVFPLWWFSVPAILKGWVDRVFAMGRFYGGGRIYSTGVSRGKRALLCLTTGGPAESYVRGGFNGDIHGILRPIQRGMLQFVGFDVLAPQIVYSPVRMTQEWRRQQLEAFAARLRNIENESPIDVGTY
jgi:NAD(P)H dehydrogenase (quinone)